MGRAVRVMSQAGMHTMHRDEYYLPRKARGLRWVRDWRADWRLGSEEKELGWNGVNGRVSWCR